MTYSQEQISELIPLYVDGNLSGQELDEFEKFLLKHPEIEEEVDAYIAMQEMYSEMREQLPEPSAELFQKIEKRIFPNEPKAIKASFYQKIQVFFKSIFQVPQIGWGLAAVQAIAIALLLNSGMPTSEQSIRTLSNSESSQVSANQINIIFHSDAMEKDIRELLLELNATIVRGPTTEGLYVIATASKLESESLLNQLRNSAIVVFAEQSL